MFFDLNIVNGGSFTKTVCPIRGTLTGLLEPLSVIPGSPICSAERECKSRVGSKAWLAESDAAKEPISFPALLH